LLRLLILLQQQRAEWDTARDVTPTGLLLLLLLCRYTKQLLLRLQLLFCA
jgi:hypothetical protein